jgi:hypothetical protein
MTDILLSAESWLAGVHKASVSQDVVYQRGSSSVNLKATAGATQSLQMDQGGAIIGFTSVDWLITAADLILDGRTILPEVGDTIAHGSRVFRVTADNSGERPYRDSGSGGLVWRIYTKRVR